MAKKRSRPSSSQSAPDAEALRRFVRSRGLAFLEDPNISSIGVGYKDHHLKNPRQVCIQFTVDEKVEDTGTALEDLRTTRIPSSFEIDGVEVPSDVLERSYTPGFREIAVEAPSRRKSRQDPILPGISVSHPTGTAGTLGAIVYDAATGTPCMLSNWHVLHGERGRIGDRVVQPGPHDDNRTERNGAGFLLRSHLGLAGDGAAARIDGRAFETDVLDLGVTPTAVARVELGDRVAKSGRTTDVTRGVVRRVDVIAKINYGGSIGKVPIGCFEIGPEPGSPADHEISMGGDSGSVWMIRGARGRATTTMAGLHFAGEGRQNPDEHALACYPHAILRKLGVVLVPPTDVEIESSARGYDWDFLDVRVPAPGLADDHWADAYRIGRSPMVHHTHFSLCQSKSRRQARFVVWNIDGARIQRVGRRGNPFRLDPKIDAAYQVGNELYRRNPLDRGHLARRADVAWGSRREAERASDESFYYSNIAPQHAAFNQSDRAGIWGQLENAILDDSKAKDLRVSVMAGPVFRDSDVEYRGIQLPREFWKLVAYQDTDDGALRVEAFVLTQRDLIRGIEGLDLDEFRLFQVSLARLTGETGLTFDDLEAYDTFDSGDGPESLGGASAREVLD